MVFCRQVYFDVVEKKSRVGVEMIARVCCAVGLMCRSVLPSSCGGGCGSCPLRLFCPLKFFDKEEELYFAKVVVVNWSLCQVT